MTDTASSHAAISGIVGTYYSKKFFRDFEPESFYYSLAPVMADMPEAEGKTINFDFFKKIDPLYSDNSSEFTATQLYQSATTVTATLHERDGYVQLSRYAVLTARNKIMDRTYESIKSTAVKTLDKMIRNDIGMIVADKAVYSAGMFNNMAIDGGTLYSTGITARVWTHTNPAGFPMYHNKVRLAQSALVTSFAKSALTVRTIQHAVSVLEAKDVPVVPGLGAYACITNPTASYHITSSAGGLKGWVSPTSSEPMRKKPSEVGVIGGAKVYNTTLAYRFPLSGDTLSTSSGALYGTLIFGQDAYGCVQMSEYGKKGFNLMIKESGTQSTNDPTNKIKQVGFSITNVGKVLNKSAGLWVLSTEIV
jgi:N4-gp56 family major capsid protein